MARISVSGSARGRVRLEAAWLFDVLGYERRQTRIPGELRELQHQRSVEGGNISNRTIITIYMFLW
jgi:hypothetical protein